MGHAKENTLTTISDSPEAQGEGKVAWELKAFVRTKEGHLPVTSVLQAPVTPTTALPGKISNFIIETPQDRSMQYCMDSQRIREGAAFAVELFLVA